MLRILAAILFLMVSASIGFAQEFAIYTNTLTNSAPVLVFSDTLREANHARISPDGRSILFTRYNNFNAQGLALETNGYTDTEAIICSVGGAACHDLIAPQPNVVAANATWTPDGKNVLYVSNQTPGNFYGIFQINVATHRSTPLVFHPFVNFADPNMFGTSFVFTLNNNLMFSQNGGAPTQITTSGADNDPKISSTGLVATMRQVGSEYHTVIVNPQDDTQTDITPAGQTEAVAEWSADANTLIYWGPNADGTAVNLYTMNSDGTNQIQVPLPAGYEYMMPAFWPGSNSKIVYSARPWGIPF